jgi:hypothetical protein
MDEGQIALKNFGRALECDLNGEKRMERENHPQ